MCKSDDALTFKEKCDKAKINYVDAYFCRKNNPDFSEEQIIEICKIKQNKSFNKIKDNAELSNNKKVKNKDEIKKLINTQICEKLGLKYSNVLLYRRKHPELTDEQILDVCMNNMYISFKAKCKRAEINYNKALLYRRKHPELTDEQVINYYKSEDNNVVTFKAKCKRAEINYARAIAYRRNHPELNDEQVIDLYKNKKITFKARCNKAEINYDKALYYKSIHPELTDEQVIKLFKANKLFKFDKRVYTELNSTRYYSCTCLNCNLKTILTVDEMLEHSKICKESK